MIGCPFRSTVVYSVVTKRSKTAWISWGRELVKGGGQRSEVEVRGQRSEVRGQRSEVEVRGQRSEVRGQRS